MCEVRKGGRLQTLSIFNGILIFELYALLDTIRYENYCCVSWIELNQNTHSFSFPKALLWFK